MVSNPAFEIIIRVVKHITGPGKPSESGQKYEPQHGTTALTSTSSLSVKQNKKFELQIVSISGVPSSVPQRRESQGCKEAPRRAQRTEIEKEKGTQAAGPLLTTVWQPPIGPTHTSLCLGEPMRRRQMSPHPLGANQDLTKIKTPLSHARKWLC